MKKLLIQIDCKDEVPNMMQDIIIRLANNLNNQIETVFINGLKLKGFEFKNKFELEQFIKQHCICKDNIDLKERIYYVDNKPFFLWKYDHEVCRQIMEGDITKTTFNANYGSFAYL